MKAIVALIALVSVSCSNQPNPDFRDRDYKTTKTVSPRKGYYILQRDGSFYKVTGNNEVFTINQ